MAIIEIADIEQATGQDFDDTDTARIQWYIDFVSNSIETITGRNFSGEQTCSVTGRSDGKGFLEVADLKSITTVEVLDPWTHGFAAITTYAWDGMDAIFDLCPYETYRVTGTYGYQFAPVEIAGIVQSLVLAGTNLNPGAVNGLVSHRVGEIIDQYGVSGAGPSARVVLSAVMADVLTAYSTANTTYRL